MPKYQRPGATAEASSILLMSVTCSRRVIELGKAMAKVVAATASDTAALQFLAPYSGVSIAEILWLKVCVY